MTAMNTAIPGVEAESWVRRRAHESMLFATVERILRNPVGLFAVAGIALILFLALAAGLIARYSPTDQAYAGAARYLSPSWEHPFGTDNLRRDVFARTLFGLRNSLMVSVAAVLFGSALGISVGFMAGYAGKWVDAVVMRAVDAMLAFPGLLAAMAILTILGTGLFNLAIAIAVFNIPAFARLSRAQMLVEKNRDYVYASQALGAGPFRIIFRHISRNALPPLLTQVALAINSAIVLSAALSFLGLGERPPEPSLGSLLNDAKSHLRDAWWMAVFPAATMAFLLLCLNFLADAINEATSPYARRKV
jgi:peptide/nickel transport system permease protein